MKTEYVIFNEGDKESLIQRISKTEVKKPWRVVVSYYRSDRSAAQNRLYWMWVQEIIDFLREHTGEVKTKRQIDSWLLDLFAPVDETTIHGKTVTVFKTTSKMNTKEMSDYLTAIDVYCASELDLLLTKPRDIYDTAMAA